MRTQKTGTPPTFLFQRFSTPRLNIPLLYRLLASRHTDQTAAMQLDPKYDDYDFPYEAATPQEGHPGNLSELQVAALDQLRMMLEAEGYTKRLDSLTLVRAPPACALRIGHY